MSEGLTLWRYNRPFIIEGQNCRVTLRSRTNGLFSDLFIDDALVASDMTPAVGPEAVRNHQLFRTLQDGSRIEVEAGFISMLNTAISVRRDGVIVHRSHPGRKIAYPEKYRQQAIEMTSAGLGDAIRSGYRNGMEDAQEKQAYDPETWKRNKVPLAVDIGLGLLFFIVAKLTDLTTAALVGAAAGIALLIAQRITKVDLLGGLAMFGIVMLLLSAGLALAFDSDEAVKYRTTALGLFTASLFLGDGLFGGKWLARRLKRYLPYADIDVARLGIGMGVMGAIMATLNLIVALYTSTDVWLFYSTFADFAVSMVLILLVFRYARGEMFRPLGPAYRDPRN